jgi:HlyD family secretion protein
MSYYSVKVSVPQDVVKKNNLRVGYAAKVRVVMGSKDNAVVIPRAAIKREGDKAYVLVADAIGRSSTARAVTTGIQNALEVEVLSGLSPGDKVAVVMKSGGAPQ